MEETGLRKQEVKMASKVGVRDAKEKHEKRKRRHRIEWEV